MRNYWQGLCWADRAWSWWTRTASRLPRSPNANDSARGCWGFSPSQWPAIGPGEHTECVSSHFDSSAMMTARRWIGRACRRGVWGASGHIDRTRREFGWASGALGGASVTAILADSAPRLRPHGPRMHAHGPRLHPQRSRMHADGPRLGTHDPEMPAQGPRMRAHDPRIGSEGIRLGTDESRMTTQGIRP